MSHRPLLKAFIRVLSSISIVLATFVAAGLFIFIKYGQGLPEYDFLKDYEPPMMSRLYTSDAQLLQEYAVERRLFVPFHQIPNRVRNAFMAAEDRNFYYHFGIDFLGTLRAALINTFTNSWKDHPTGASTITQQVAKNFLVGNEKTFGRKIKEAIIAMRLEFTLPKDRIFELYLNQIYLGAGTYGIASAALTYFDKELEELTIDEAAFLAALPKAPTTLTKNEDISRAQARRNWVIERMAQEYMITISEAEKAKAQPLSFRRHRELPIKADYFTDTVRRELTQRFGNTQVHQGGMTVRTTMNIELQKAAERSLRQGLTDYDRRHGWRGPVTQINWEKSDTSQPWLAELKKLKKPLGIAPWEQAVVIKVEPNQARIGFASGSEGVITLADCHWAAPCLVGQKVGLPPRHMKEIVRQGDVILVSKSEDDHFKLEQVPNVTGALVAMDPKTGRILALAGGYDFESTQFNCAIQAFRQPGSCFKPFVYLVALEQGMSPESQVLDAPISISLGGKRGFYTPQNYSRRYLGLCPLRIGLEQSRNVMTIRLAQKVGMNSIIDCAKRFGINDHMPKQLAMVLGAGETTVVRLVAAYAAIANGGYKVTPHTIDWVQDRYGETLFTIVDGLQPQERIASVESIINLTSMLVGVTQNGTARSLTSLGFEVAGKTGTTNNYNDAWFVGFTKDLVVGVFIGFPQPKTLGNGETGGRLAVPIFKDFIEHIYTHRPKPHFEITTIKREPALLTEEEPYIFEECNPQDFEVVAEPIKNEIKQEEKTDSEIIDIIEG
ncbi:penicillin-binding protein 1A [Candidatus Odyssella thessalonicensis]|uniref:penicillin-binding protein 1A n=1 Tax=Candidatus Odyssella thessalonicensis TaxID=84647 RepID=UPI000225AED6|nr:PBP1A family penicillin-binding protein [Candidatus Odyssella thessalonicensis]